MCCRKAKERSQGLCVSTQSNQVALLIAGGNQGDPVPPQQEMLMHLWLRKSLVGTNPKSWAKALSYLPTLSPLSSCFYCAVVGVSPLQTNDLIFRCCHFGSFTPQLLPLAEPHTTSICSRHRGMAGNAPLSRDSAQQILPSLAGKINGNRNPVALPEVLLG